MNNDDDNTTAIISPHKFIVGDTYSDVADTNTSSESSFVEIEFPKLRTIRVSKDKTILFSVNYTKIAEQLKIFISNKPNDK